MISLFLVVTLCILIGAAVLVMQEYRRGLPLSASLQSAALGVPIVIILMAAFVGVGSLMQAKAIQQTIADVRCWNDKLFESLSRPCALQHLRKSHSPQWKIEIQGILKSDQGSIVEYSWQTSALPARHNATATFQLYDDGWRLNGDTANEDLSAGGWYGFITYVNSGGRPWDPVYASVGGSYPSKEECLSALVAFRKKAEARQEYWCGRGCVKSGSEVPKCADTWILQNPASKAP